MSSLTPRRYAFRRPAASAGDHLPRMRGRLLETDVLRRRAQTVLDRGCAASYAFQADTGHGMDRDRLLGWLLHALPHRIPPLSPCVNIMGCSTRQRLAGAI